MKHELKNQEEPNFLFLVGARHTGYKFLSTLLSLHPQIGFCDVNVLHEKGRNSQCPFIISSVKKFHIEAKLDTVLTMDAKQAFFNIFADYESLKYIAIASHIHYAWFWPLIFYPPFPFKMIVSMRHPYNILKSFYRRGDQQAPAMGWCIQSIYAAQQQREKTLIFPVDLLGQKCKKERLKIIEDIFSEFLSLALTEELHKFIEEWPRINSCGNQRELDFYEHQEAIIRIQNSRIMELLSSVGIYYDKTSLDTHSNP
ncbi:hypothetical protein LCGC14_0511970 [marine sediment metagenome]|uniref:Sulfotransferase domain-containing protein n=1 Tax=marine sediment metagenome TaxID=412755 RepID=A0A0F9UMF3_9ZZZZ